jgi:thioredoxin-related protein
MSIFSRFTAVALIGLFIHPANAAGWSTDFQAARQQAADSGRNLLIDFTGSDWCSWCIKLRNEVFAKDGFEAAVKDKFVLVELDYPRNKTKLGEAVLKQNMALLEVYPIKAYPSVLLCDAAGKPFAITGYRPGGPEAYVPHLTELLAKKTARDEAFASAAGKEGVEKARSLIAALDGLGLDPDMIRASYPEVGQSILAADPDDVTGYGKKQRAEVRFAAFMTDLRELGSKQDLDGVGKLVLITLEDPLIQGEIRQQVHGHHAGTLASAGKKDEAIAVLQKAVEEDPAGARTKELQDFIGILEREKAGLPPAKP